MKLRRLLAFGAVLAAWWVTQTGPAAACDTPVYRYALANWAPASFDVFCFHQGRLAKHDEDTCRVLADLGSGARGANVSLVRIDVAKLSALDGLPTEVRNWWKARKKRPSPGWLILTPWGATLSDDRLDVAEIGRLIDSPMRTRIAQLLSQGKGAVLVVLLGGNEAENRRVEGVVAQVAAQTAARKAAKSPGERARPARPAAANPAKASKAAGGNPAGLHSPRDDSEGDAGDPATLLGDLQVAVVKLARNDANEHWLLRTLDLVEPDLAQLGNQPMVFGVYGRGRVMEPYVGRGITADNLTELLTFLAGACSCQAKERNPGKDLLFHWDWDKTAERVIAADAIREQGTGVRGEGTGVREQGLGVRGQEAASRAQPTADRQPQTAGGPQATGDQGVSDLWKTRKTSENGRDNVGEPPLTPVPSTPVISSSLSSHVTYSGSGRLWTYGAALGLAALLVLLVGIVLLRRQPS
jgi:hypothetical protein